jgi:hypothetical protein
MKLPRNRMASRPAVPRTTPNFGWANFVWPAQGGGGTCDCGGAPFGCTIEQNNCEQGFVPDCTNNIFACTCQCKPR